MSLRKSKKSGVLVPLVSVGVIVVLVALGVCDTYKGTKVLTLGAGHGGYKDVDILYTRPLAIRMRYMCIYACAVLFIGGPFYRFTDSWSLTSLLRVGHRVATLLDSTRESILARAALQFLAPPRYAELVEVSQC